jgi:NADPH2:quinone reductase
VGAKVIATASSQEKLAFVRKFGGLTDQDFTLVYDDTPAASPSGAKKKSSMLEWQAQVLKITKGKGVDVVFDPVGLLNVGLPDCYSSFQSVLSFQSTFFTRFAGN